MIEHPLDRRPVIVAIAGSNGAGKTTFFHSHLREAGLRFVNADDIARELDVSAYEAAEIADALRHELVKQNIRVGTQSCRLPLAGTAHSSSFADYLRQASYHRALAQR
jgi:predicted ABC-type ATPase